MIENFTCNLWQFTVFGFIMFTGGVMSGIRIGIILKDIFTKAR